MKKLEIYFRESPKNIGLVLFVSLFWILFLWNFWDKGIYALGFNVSVWLLLALVFLNKCTEGRGLFQKKNLFLLIPLLLIILSYSIYDNTFIKFISILVYPVVFVISLNYSFLKKRKEKIWVWQFLKSMIARFFMPLAKLNASSKALAQTIRIKTNKGRTARSIVLGLAIFLALALFIVIPLLSSADALFEQRLRGIVNFFENIISLEIIFKIVIFYVIALFLYAIFLAWGKPIDNKENVESKKKVDSMVYGVVIGGTLLLYLLFLWVQFERIWVSSLPIEFNDVEILVKSGFWQMMALSIINVVIFFFSYKRTNNVVQWILSIFTGASLMLLASAAYRMFLYVTIYGLSYEKFFASYTIIFCIILFIYLLIKSVARTKLDIIKFLVFLFIWMYAIISIMPTEQFILKTNIRLAQKENSRINLSESRILSADILSYVEKNKDSEFMKINNKDESEVNWSEWLEDTRKTVEDKKWYEMNLGNLWYFLNR